MNREQLKSILPHREPMLLVDQVHVDEDHIARGAYTVRGDEWFLKGHFPGNPVVPGVVQCEMLAQACCALLENEMKGCTPYFTGIKQARFRNPVLPGDTFVSECAITAAKPPFYFARVKGFVGGRLCAEGEFSFVLKKGG